jgi:glycosyltransferase involved in cell wall biosynthesis
MNVLFVSRNSPFESIGGIERYIDNLINYYKFEKTLNSMIYLMLPTDGKNYSKKYGRVVIYFDNSINLSKNNLINKKDIQEKAHLFSRSVVKIVKEKRIDVICAENFHTDLPAAYTLMLNMVTMSQKIPLVLQLHSFATTELQTELINQLKWDKISCVSKSIAGDCYRKGTDINYLSTHYLGVDTNNFNSDKNKNFNLKKKLNLSLDSKVILTATRIICGKNNILKEKGIINLIESFSKLSPRYPDWKLLIAIGKPPERLNTEFNIAYELLQGYIKLHNVGANTILKTFVLDEMANVYRGSDLFVLASENETFGQVFIEAMSCGVPVIGTKVGGIPEIISDSENGYLIPVNDASILAQKIEKLMNDSEIRENFISLGQKIVKEKFTMEQQFFSFNEMLKKVVEDFN